MITGDEIRSGRELLGLTQAELASQVGVSFRTIGNWERGETSPLRYEARLRKLFRGHDPAPAQRSIQDYSDTELLLEVSRRMSEQRTRHDRPADQPQPLTDDAPVASEPQPDGATSRRHLSAVPGTLSRDEREEMYRRAEQVDLSREPFAAADPEDDSDDDESV